MLDGGVTNVFAQLLMLVCEVVSEMERSLVLTGVGMVFNYNTGVGLRG